VFVDIGSQMAFIPPFYTKEEPYGPGFFLFNFNVIFSNHPQEYLAKFGYRTIFLKKRPLQILK
jgi:hypothetical protein